MTIQKLIPALVAVLSLGACSFIQKPAPEAKAPEVKAGQLVLKMSSSASEKDVAAVLARFEKKELVDPSARVYLVIDKSLAGNETEEAAELEAHAAVEFAEPNFIRQINQVPQDPMWLNLWGLANYGQDAPNGIEGVEGADIGVLEAWKTTKGSKDIVVAVLDSGVDYTHPDLIENIWVNKKEKDGVPGVDDDGNGYVDDLHGWDAISDARTQPHFGQVGDPDPMDDNGHGTHVAGTIGARGGNGIGVVGVNWQVSIMGVKFLSAQGSGSSIDEFRAIRYIIANRPDVVNGSYGGGAPSKLIAFAIEEARKAGILFVFAAGNDSTDNDFTPAFPASYPHANIISVAATDSRDQVASFSNVGRTSVDIAAPGENIMSTIPVSMAKALGPYASFSGTSMAAPHVAGAAALLLSADPSLKGQPEKIAERLMRTAQFKPHFASLVQSGGRLSIANAISNTTTQNPSFGGQWQTLNMMVATPAHPRERVDNAWKISVPGAKAIRVHIQFAEIDDGFDVARLYDTEYRPVMNIAGHLIGEWSPIILGDSAYLKFSNAMVSIEGSEPFANFNSGGVIVDRVEYIQ